MESHQNKWVIIFLIYADFVSEKNQTLSFDNDLACELNSMLSDILESKVDDSRVSKYIVFASTNYTTLKKNAELSARSNSYLLRVKQNQFGYNEFDLIKKFSGTATTVHNVQIGKYSIQKTKILKKIFLKIKECESKNGFNDIKTVILTWDHGSAFGIFKTAAIQLTELFLWTDIIIKSGFYAIKKLVESIIGKRNFHSNIAKANRLSIEFYPHYPKKLLPDSYSNIFENKALKDVSGNDDEGVVVTNDGIVEILTNEELRDSIKQSFEHVDIVLMMNCLMMNVHTAFALKDCVNFLVAPQGLIANPGYNYEKILNYMFINSPKAINLASFK